MHGYRVRKVWRNIHMSGKTVFGSARDLTLWAYGLNWMSFRALRGLLSLLLQLPIALISGGELSCQPVSGCRCEGSGFQLDIGGLFSYPVTYVRLLALLISSSWCILSGSFSIRRRIMAGVQNFSFSPCEGLRCTGSQPAAVSFFFSLVACTCHITFGSDEHVFI